MADVELQDGKADAGTCTGKRKAQDEREGEIVDFQFQELRNSLSVEALPYVSAHLPGIGGKLKERNDFFQVVEIPLIDFKNHRLVRVNGAE